jgi:hypothetical protein
MSKCKLTDTQTDRQINRNLWGKRVQLVGVQVQAGEGRELANCCGHLAKLALRQVAAKNEHTSSRLGLLRVEP